ncbi:bifunctional enoyl-CoA hydratase/phosphate acetyltransferase [Soehngenia saccharolytica]|nr:bifunctional enoyl-CoA hydratase/phosphate acetyltransferase [Soehngenia saccharolytica]
MIKTMDELYKLKGKSKKMAVVACHDHEVLEAAIESYNMGLTTPILIGDKEKTHEISISNGLDISEFEFIEEKDLSKASEIGVKLAHSGEADFLMKGLVDTSILLKAVLNKKWGIRKFDLLSHVMIYQVDTYHKLLFLTDGGMNLQPNLEEKINIINNAAIVARALGLEEIKVAVLAAKEKVDPKMPATMDAAKLKEIYLEGKFDQDIIVDGPFALDLAVSKSACDIKGIESTVGGDADVLLVPNIEMGNGIGKAITYLAKGESAGIIVGAKVPIVLTSRADDNRTKLNSIALGNAIAINA